MTETEGVDNPVLKVLNRMDWNQTQLARAVGVKQACISIWQREGRISPSSLLAVCKISGFFPNELDPTAPSFEQIATARSYFEGLGR